MSSSAVTLPTRIGFIGLGNMGGPMVTNLAKKIPSNTKVYVYDVSDEAVDNTINRSGVEHVFQKCKSAREVAEKSDLLISIVPEGPHVRSVYLDPESGVLAAKNLDNKILVDSSTIDIATSNEVRKHALTRHPRCTFYDAPVSGGVEGSAAGTLAIMIGCTETDEKLPLLMAIFSFMGKLIVPCGGPSLGLTAKFANNYISLTITLANAEMFNFAIRSGMDPRVLQNLFSQSTACNRNCETSNPVPGLSPGATSSKGYKGGFKVQYVKKDLGLAMEAAKGVDARLYLAPAAYDAYIQTAEDERCSGLDAKVVFRWLGGDEDWAEKFKDGG